MTCGQHWLAKGVWDGTYGVGQQMSALSVIGATLVASAPQLLTNMTGGTSEGNAAAGTGSTDNIDLTPVITTKDRAGAGILTALVIAGVLGGVVFLVTGD